MRAKNENKDSERLKGKVEIGTQTSKWTTPFCFVNFRQNDSNNTATHTNDANTYTFNNLHCGHWHTLIPRCAFQLCVRRYREIVGKSRGGIYVPSVSFVSAYI